MSIFTLPTGIDLDSYDEYESGCIDQRDRCEHEARILAFGAIRRAAEVARRYDAQYNEAYFARHWEECERITNGHSIRVAIRAAIGSDKS